MIDKQSLLTGVQNVFGQVGRKRHSRDFAAYQRGTRAGFSPDGVCGSLRLRKVQGGLQGDLIDTANRL